MQYSIVKLSEIELISLRSNTEYYHIKWAVSERLSFWAER